MSISDFGEVLDLSFKSPVAPRVPEWRQQSILPYLEAVLRTQVKWGICLREEKLGCSYWVIPSISGPVGRHTDEDTWLREVG